MSAIKKFYNTWQRRWGKIPVVLTLTLAMLLSVVALAIAAEYVVTLADPNHLINGAWFMQFLPEDATGTGLFNPFVRLSGGEVVQGYNTDYRPLEFDESQSWTDSIPLSDVPYFFYEGTLYREFQLDINQGNPTIISLDEVQIWLGGADAATITGFVEEATETDFGNFPGYTLQEVYNLDADEDNDLVLDYNYAAGSGKRDLKLLVPDDYFKPYDEACEYMGTGCEQYMVFFTQFGINEPNNDGFEEWGVAIYNSVSGYKWHDMNANGIWDAGEPGLEDWQICAQEVVGGEDIGDPICTVTNEDGKYIIPLIDGDYRIYETCPTAVSPWYQSYPTPTGGVCGSGTHDVSLSGGETAADLNFGNYQGIPDIDIDKTGDTLSKIGDPVDYTITVDNTSTEGTPDLYCRITDPMLEIDEYVTLAWDAANYVINETYTVPEGAPDPLVNTASVSCTYVGDTTEQASDTDDHSVNLFQPGVDVEKECDDLSKATDDVHCVVTITNTSSLDAPDLIFDSFVDNLYSGEVPEACDTLGYGGSCTIEYDYTVLETDPDPLVNTATVYYHPFGFTNPITDSDTETINLFQPGVDVEKECDDLSKATDDVHCVVTITNTSSLDAPDLIFDSFVDNLYSGEVPEACDTLGYGGSCTIEYDYTVLETDPDPLVNTATVYYHPFGFTNPITDSDTETINLFQPGVDVEKECDDLSKATDDVHCVVTITNTSSSDAPDLILDSFEDDLFSGEVPEACDTLGYGASCTIEYDYTVLETDPDPLENTATAHYHPFGFTNDIWDSDTETINLFQPSFTFKKEAAEEYSKAGDVIHYTITLDNTSSADSPDLVCTITDSMLGIDETVTLAYNAANHVINDTYTVKAGDPDPLVNTANVSCSPVGFLNVLPGSDYASVDLLHPAFTLSKECVVEPVVAGVAADFEVEFVNTGDVDLVATFDEDLTGTGCPLASMPVTVGDGETLTCTVSKMADTDPSPSVVSNTVNVHVTLPTMYGLDNYWDAMASDSCDIYGVKSGTKWEDVNADGMWDEMTEPVLSGWKIHFFEWDEGLEHFSPYYYYEVLTDAGGIYEYDMVEPGRKYAVCEVLDAGYMQTFPNVTLPAEGYVDCTQFGSQYGPVGYEIMLASGEYEFDNDFGNFKPLGCTYTLGYWKTHSMYGPAGPYDPTWDLQDGGDADFLSSSWYVGLSWYEMFNTPPAGGNPYVILAHQYMAAWLNIHNVDPMKMANPTVLGTAFADAEYLLSIYTPDYDFKEDPDGVSAEFIMLAELLDDFNNGYLGVPHCE